MKTKEEVKAFIASFNFSIADMERITGFLLGKGIVERGEMVEFSTFKGKKGFALFDDFYNWFEGEDDAELGDLVMFLLEEQDKADKSKDSKRFERIEKLLLFLAEAFELEVEE